MEENHWDGSSYMSNGLHHEVPRSLVEHYSECCCFWISLDEINIWIGRLTKAASFPQRRWVSVRPMGIWIEQKVKENLLFCLTIWELWQRLFMYLGWNWHHQLSCFSGLWTSSGTIPLGLWVIWPNSLFYINTLTKQPLWRIKMLDDALIHFWKTNKHNEVGWLLLMSLNKVVKEKDELSDLNFQLKHMYMIWKLQYMPWRRAIILVAKGLRSLKVKCRIWSCSWLYYNASWTPSLIGYLLFKWGH